MKPTLTSFREALSSFVTKSSPSQSSQSTWSGDAQNYFEKIISLRSSFLELVFVYYKKHIVFYLHDHGRAGDRLDAGEKSDRLLLPLGVRALHGHLLLLYCLLALIGKVVLILRLTCELKIIELTFLSPSW